MKTEQAVGLPTWTLAELPAALQALAGASTPPPAPPAEASTADGLERWLEMAATAVRLTVAPVETTYPHLLTAFTNATPVLLRLPNQDTFLWVIHIRRDQAHCLTPDNRFHLLPLTDLRSLLCAEAEARVLPEITRLLDSLRFPPRQRAKAEAALLQKQLTFHRVSGLWQFAPPPGHSLRSSGVLPYLGQYLGIYTVQYALWLAAWVLIGRGALNGRLETGWLWAWAMLMATITPLQLASSWVQGLLSIGAGTWLKQSLLYGALQLEPEEVRHQGVGQLLGRVIESEAVESLALSGGLLGFTALIELLAAVWILHWGLTGWLHPALLLGWLAVLALWGWRYVGQRQAWTNGRLQLTHDLVEALAGHRTHLVQGNPVHWYQQNDQQIAAYLQQSIGLDQATLPLLAFAQRGWLFVTLAGLLPSFVRGGDPVLLAITMAGSLSAGLAFKKLGAGIIRLSSAGIAWQSVADLFQAAQRTSRPPAALAPNPDPVTPLIELHRLQFRYGRRAEAILQGLDLQIMPGDRLLLEGDSGSGKSTLSHLLLGIRQPTAGLMLLNGMDWATIGPVGWRQRVTAVPQFHENHIFSDTFLFNLLMGKRWPPRPQDMAQAEALCRALGLGDLLNQMPSGLLQRIGETGWQLSHGERSRLFIARALLQQADLLILDESFAALDPHNLERSLACVLDNAPTLLVIAHP